MKKCWLVLIVVFATCQLLSAEVSRPRVPSNLKFADMQLKLTEGLRREIQKEVDELTRSAKYYNIKADRIKLYFPIIEQTLVENGVPAEFKYLAVQESALISDAVSSSKAVGFWQFKDFTGREVGLRIDRKVDERLNVMASTKGAAKYFNRNNFYFRNWIYAILAHMTGRGGAQKYVDEKYFGAKKMTLDRNTHWYVRRFLAHMIAYQGAENGPHSEGMVMDVYMKGAGMTLREIAKKTKTDEEELKKYNKWLKSGAVPSDKSYAVLVPKIGGKSNFKGGKHDAPIASNDKTSNKSTTAYPSLVKNPESVSTVFIKINGLPCILAKAGDTMESLSRKSQLHIERLAKYNDLAVDAKIEEGGIYYLKRKRSKARSYYHTAQQDESLWGVSQKFGIRLKNLAKLNRMSIIDELKPGRVLWLRSKRPSDVPVEIKELPMLPVDEVVSLEEAIREDEGKGNLKLDTIPDLPHHDEVILAQEQNSDVSIRVVKHVVQKGESLYAIAQDFGISVSDLMEWNSLQETSLAIGQVLAIHGERLPEKVKEEETPEEKLEVVEPQEVKIHVVSPGDTVYGISRQYGLSVKDLLRMNQKDNFDLAIGEKLILSE